MIKKDGLNNCWKYIIRDIYLYTKLFNLGRIMATTANQNLSLGKLQRAVSASSDASYTAEYKLSMANAGNEVSMSDFSISSCGSNVAGYAYLWEQTTEGYYIDVQNAGNLWISHIGADDAHFTWAKGWADSVIEITATAGYSASFAAKAISNARTGDGSENPFAAGSNNIVAVITGSYSDDRQSDGYNDHATNYNTNLFKSITIVDSYGGSPSCLLEGTPIDMADGTSKKVEDLQVGDWVLSMNMPGQIDEDESDWRQCRFEDSDDFTQHSASVQDINFDFSYNYWNINNGQELITAEHEMLYRPPADLYPTDQLWGWLYVPNMLVGGSLMDKNGNAVEITSLENVLDQDDGFEVVQIDVEPLDVYFGKTFLVHNKGSDSDPF